MATTTKDVVPEEVKQREGQALKRLIELSGKSQPSIALETGVGTKAYISQLCTGHRPLNADTAAKLARALNTVVDNFSPRLADSIREAAAHVKSTTYTEANNTPILACETVRPLQFAKQQNTTAWPFSATQEKLQNHLTSADLARIDGFILGVLQTREADQTGADKSSNGHG